MNRATDQLALDLTLRDDLDFGNFIGNHNSDLIGQLHRVAEGRPMRSLLFVWGVPGCGKTHLLTACYREADARGNAPRYIALHELANAKGAAAILEDVEQSGILLIDGLDLVAGDPAWESGLFRLCNLANDGKLGLVITATRPPTRLGLELPDLVTRLMAGLTYQVLALNDEQRIAALRARAAQRGFELPEDPARYLVNRCRRDTGHLFGLLDRLDRATLEHKRLITIPFLRTLDLD